MKKIRAAICGLGFGGAFVPIWRDHPMVESIGIFDIDKKIALQTAQYYGIAHIYDSFEDVLSDDTLDAVHLTTPIPLHEEQTVRVLESGKHCACTVPMTTSLEGVRRIVETVKRTQKKYMMMETTLYTRQFMHVQKMLKSGEIGRIQFLRGSHYQDMENWPEYWMGLPPMWYGTHAVSPLVALAGCRVKSVYAVGSGSMREELKARYRNPFPVETALFTFENGMHAEATRSLFETAREYQEGLFVYGSKASFEWGFRDLDAPVITRLVPRDHERGFLTQSQSVELGPDYGALPEALRIHTTSSEDYDATSPEKALVIGAAAGHHGSHPHLVHEFVTAIVEDRKPWTDEIMAANITAACVCAHESALRGGVVMEIPAF